MTIQNNYMPMRGALTWLIALNVVLCGAVPASGACKAPRYRVVRTWQVDPSGIRIDISVGLEDFAPERLICLAGALRERYPARNVRAFIFSSREAARGFKPASVEAVPVVERYQSMLHASYIYDLERHENYLQIWPNGVTADADLGISTLIGLPVNGTPSCTLEINGRCLLEFQHISYPSSEIQTEISGRVTLAGSIGRNGATSDLAVVDAKADPPERQSALIDWAKRNFSTWRFEPAKHKDAVRMTYRFEVADPSIRYEHRVVFQLPDEVRILTWRIY
jgi:hypothetical protein